VPQGHTPKAIIGEKQWPPPVYSFADASVREGGRRGREEGRISKNPSCCPEPFKKAEIYNWCPSQGGKEKGEGEGKGNDLRTQPIISICPVKRPPPRALKKREGGGEGGRIFSSVNLF